MKLAIIALTRGGCRTARRYGDLLPEADIYLKREAAEMDPRQQTAGMNIILSVGWRS